MKKNNVVVMLIVKLLKRSFKYDHWQVRRPVYRCGCCHRTVTRGDDGTITEARKTMPSRVRDKEPEERGFAGRSRVTLSL
jgi:hypothetical protein